MLTAKDKRDHRIRKRATPEVAAAYASGAISARRADALLYLPAKKQRAELARVLSTAQERERTSQIVDGAIRDYLDRNQRVNLNELNEILRRVQKADAKIDSLLAARRNGNGIGARSQGSDPPSPVNAFVLARIVLPQDKALSESWWSQLVTGSTSREIEPNTAIFVCRCVLETLLGQLRAKGVPVSFDDGPITPSDLHSTLESLTGGPFGWRVLLDKAGRG